MEQLREIFLRLDRLTDYTMARLSAAQTIADARLAKRVMGQITEHKDWLVYLFNKHERGFPIDPSDYSARYADAINFAARLEKVYRHDPDPFIEDGE